MGLGRWALHPAITERLDTQRYGGVTSDKRTPFHSESTVITTTTNVAVKAAVASKRHWIDQLIVTNHTAAELNVIVLQDGTTTIGHFTTGDPVTASPAPTTVYDFANPIEVTSGAAINAKTLDATTGDFFVQANGWVED